MTKRIKIYHVISLSLIAVSIAVMLLCYPYTLRRVIEALRDIGATFGYYFFNLFDKEFPFELHFLELPDKYYNDYLPFSVEELQRKISVFFSALFKKDSFLLYLVFLLTSFNNLAIILTFALPIVLLLPWLFKTLALSPNTKHNEDTKPLVFYKRYVEKYLCIAIEEIKQYFVFVFSKKYYTWLLLIIWAVSLNILSIVLGLFSYYLYFVSSIDILSSAIQIVRLTSDLLIMFNCANILFWLFVAYKITDKIRRNIGYNRLEHHEMCNRGFINERPIFNMACGSMDTGKTKFCVDMAISQGIMFRGDLLKALQENDMKFSNFPWINLEKDFEKQVDKGKIYDISSLRAYYRKKQRVFEKSPSPEKIWGYDYTRYSMWWDSGLKLEYVFEVIFFYVELYMIYIMDSSLMVANFSIRDDSYIYDAGNFPLWDTELFKRDSKELDELSHYAHILNYDSMRLGRKLCEQNKNMLARVGVYVMTEIGKERGNKVENEGKKKQDDITNQKNDLFDYWLKLIRHMVTIYYTPYAKIFTDEQRPDSLGANTRQLGDIIWIDEKSDLYIVMPCFLIEDLFYDFAYKKFLSFYTQYRFNRGDNTLLMYLLKGFMHKFFSHYQFIYNTFGTYDLALTVQNGRMDKDGKAYKYYISTKKVHSDRYSTDCYADVFDEVSKEFPYFINDIDTYKATKATYEEMKRQESYMFNDVCEFTGVDK